MLTAVNFSGIPSILCVNPKPLFPAGVRESGWTEASAAAGSRGFQLVVDGARLEPTPEALHKCMTFLVKRIKVGFERNECVMAC